MNRRAEMLEGHFDSAAQPPRWIGAEAGRGCTIIGGGRLRLDFIGFVIVNAWYFWIQLSRGPPSARHSGRHGTPGIGLES